MIRVVIGFQKGDNIKKMQFECFVRMSLAKQKKCDKNGIQFRGKQPQRMCKGLRGMNENKNVWEGGNRKILNVNYIILPKKINTKLEGNNFNFLYYNKCYVAMVGTIPEIAIHRSFYANFNQKIEWLKGNLFIPFDVKNIVQILFSIFKQQFFIIKSLMSQEKESPQDDKQSQIKEYRCFCAKNYNSYAGLYLHLKSKHEDAFALYKNMKISKLLNPVFNEPSKIIFKLKEPTKEQTETKNCLPEKVPHLNNPSLGQQEPRTLVRDQQFYVYHPQPAPSVSMNYYPTIPTQPYMLPTQPYFSNPVREYPVSNQPIPFTPGSPYQYYQYPVHLQPQQQVPAYSFQTQPFSNSYLVSNGLQYWPSHSYAQSTLRQRPVDTQQDFKCLQNDHLKICNPSNDKAAKQKSRGEQKKVKPQPKNHLSPEEDSLRKKIKNEGAHLCSDRTKTPQSTLL